MPPRAQQEASALSLLRPVGLPALPMRHGAVLSTCMQDRNLSALPMSAAPCGALACRVEACLLCPPPCPPPSPAVGCCFSVACLVPATCLPPPPFAPLAATAHPPSRVRRATAEGCRRDYDSVGSSRRQPRAYDTCYTCPKRMSPLSPTLSVLRASSVPPSRRPAPHPAWARVQRTRMAPLSLPKTMWHGGASWA